MEEEDSLKTRYDDDDWRTRQHKFFKTTQTLMAQFKCVLNHYHKAVIPNLFINEEPCSIF